MRTVQCRCGFSLLELLIVIAIIAILTGILLAMLGPMRERARDSATRQQLTSLSMAIDTYHHSFGGLPGFLSETEQSAHKNDFTSSENLIVSLMGRVEASPGPGRERIGATGYYVDHEGFGSGPRTVAGAVFSSFYPLKAQEVARIEGDNSPNSIPEIVDISRQLPILYFRGRGGATRPAARNAADPDHGAFHLSAVEDYTTATALRSPPDAREFDQSTSLLGSADDDAVNNLAWLVGSPPFRDNSPNDPGDVAAGGYLLMTPGRDRVYFSNEQIGGATRITSPDQLKNFDDIIHAGAAP